MRILCSLFKEVIQAEFSRSLTGRDILQERIVSAFTADLIGVIILNNLLIDISLLSIVAWS